MNQNHIHNLPEDLIDVIFAVSTFEFIKTLWPKYKIDTDERQEILGRETGLYLSGVTKEADFAPRLVFNLDLDKQSALSLKDEIDSQLVSKAKDSFEKAQNGEFLLSMNLPQDDNMPEFEEPATQNIETPQPTGSTNNPASVETPGGTTLQTPAEEMEPEGVEGTELDRRLDEIIKVKKEDMPGFAPTTQIVPKPKPQNQPTYGNTDPYREPIS